MTVQTLSASTRTTIDELVRRAGERAWLRGRGHLEAILALVQQVADAGEPLAIPRVIALTLDARRELAEAAGAAVASLRARGSATPTHHPAR